jgi:hypothetical protein
MAWDITSADVLQQKDSQLMTYGRYVIPRSKLHSTDIPF